MPYSRRSVSRPVLHPKAKPAFLAVVVGASAIITNYALTRTVEPSLLGAELSAVVAAVGAYLAPSPAVVADVTAALPVVEQVAHQIDPSLVSAIEEHLNIHPAGSVVIKKADAPDQP